MDRPTARLPTLPTVRPCATMVATAWVVSSSLTDDDGAMHMSTAVLNTEPTVDECHLANAESAAAVYEESKDELTEQHYTDRLFAALHTFARSAGTGGGYAPSSLGEILDQYKPVFSPSLAISFVGCANVAAVARNAPFVTPRPQLIVQSEWDGGWLIEYGASRSLVQLAWSDARIRFAIGTADTDVVAECETTHQRHGVDGHAIDILKRVFQPRFAAMMEHGQWPGTIYPKYAELPDARYYDGLLGRAQIVLGRKPHQQSSVGTRQA